MSGPVAGEPTASNEAADDFKVSRRWRCRGSLRQNPIVRQGGNDRYKLANENLPPRDGALLEELTEVGRLHFDTRAGGQIRPKASNAPEVYGSAR